MNDLLNLLQHGNLTKKLVDSIVSKRGLDYLKSENLAAEIFDKLFDKATKKDNNELANLTLTLKNHLENIDRFMAILIFLFKVCNSVLDARIKCLFSLRLLSGEFILSFIDICLILNLFFRYWKSVLVFLANLSPFIFFLRDMRRSLMICASFLFFLMTVF